MLWHFERAGLEFRAAPVRIGDLVIVADRRGQVVGLNAADGTERWTKDLGGDTDSNGAVVDNSIYYTGLDHRLLRIDVAIDEEVEAARHLADLSVRLLQFETLADGPALDAVRTLQQDNGLRHLALRIVDERGRTLLEPPPDREVPGLIDLLADAHRRWSPSPPPPAVTWPLRRPDGRTWTLSLQPTLDGERREALADFLVQFLVLLGCIAGLQIGRAHV